jgi:hypothetical protein
MSLIVEGNPRFSIFFFCSAFDGSFSLPFGSFSTKEKLSWFIFTLKTIYSWLKLDLYTTGILPFNIAFVDEENIKVLNVRLNLSKLIIQ